MFFAEFITNGAQPHQVNFNFERISFVKIVILGETGAQVKRKLTIAELCISIYSLPETGF